MILNEFLLLIVVLALLLSTIVGPVTYLLVLIGGQVDSISTVGASTIDPFDLCLVQICTPNLLIICPMRAIMQLLWRVDVGLVTTKFATLQSTELGVHLAVRAFTLPLCLIVEEILVGLHSTRGSLSDGAHSDRPAHRGCTIAM